MVPSPDLLLIYLAAEFEQTGPEALREELLEGGYDADALEQARKYLHHLGRNLARGPWVNCINVRGKKTGL